MPNNLIKYFLQVNMLSNLIKFFLQVNMPSTLIKLSLQVICLVTSLNSFGR